MKPVVAAVFHKNVAPGSPVAVNTELPQLFSTDTPGAAGIGLGAAVPLPAAPMQPFTVWVTVYVPC